MRLEGDKFWAKLFLEGLFFCKSHFLHFEGFIFSTCKFWNFLQRSIFIISSKNGPFENIKSSLPYLNDFARVSFAIPQKSAMVDRSYLPVQVLLSACSWYPVLQEHWYEPCVFLHTWEHLSVFSLHSSISKMNVLISSY